MPWEIIARSIERSHPYGVFFLRTLISLPFFEKALYELPDEAISAGTILALADKIERGIQGGLAPRPLLCYPHLLSGDSSCYYHGYVLAQMGVYQTRAYFTRKYGPVFLDNPAVGKELTEVFWKPGNSQTFFELMERMTGQPLASESWIDKITEPVDSILNREHKAYCEVRQRLASGDTEKLDSSGLRLRVRVVHGTEVITDSAEWSGDGDALEPVSQKFKLHLASAFSK